MHTSTTHVIMFGVGGSSTDNSLLNAMVFICKEPFSSGYKMKVGVDQFLDSQCARYPIRHGPTQLGCTLFGSAPRPKTINK